MTPFEKACARALRDLSDEDLQAESAYAQQRRFVPWFGAMFGIYEAEREQDCWCGRRCTKGRVRWRHRLGESGDVYD